MIGKRAIFCFSLITAALAQYQPTWKSIDSRPLPEWYDEAKIGIFLHWGVFSVPGIVNEWFWEKWQSKSSPLAVNFMKKNYPPSFTYQDFASMFHAEFFNSDQWADVFKASGAKYYSYF
jgi:alpha-L-fucosidase